MGKPVQAIEESFPCLILGKQHHGVSYFSNIHLVARKAVLFRQAHRLTLTVRKYFRGFHAHHLLLIVYTQIYTLVMAIQKK
jgi:hypothetical protein